MFEELEKLDQQIDEIYYDSKSANIQMIEYKLGKKFTDEQIKFAEEFNADILSDSLPGSGKTSAAIFKLLLAQMDGVYRGSEMTAMSFTRAATGSLKWRYLEAQEKLGMRQSPQFKTLLGLCFQLLRENHKLLGIHRFERASNMSYADTCDYLINAGNDLGIAVTKKNVGAVRAAINDANSSLIFDPEHLVRRKTFMKCGLSIEEFTTLRKSLYELNRSTGMIDVGCLTLYTLELLLKHPEIAEKERAKRKFLLCDECQDLSLLHLKLLSLVTQKICLIGDINQQIYGFNGACVKILDEFKKLYPNHKKLNLTQSFRCGEAIAEYAKTVAAPNGDTAEDFKGVVGLESEVLTVRSLDIESVADLVAKDYREHDYKFDREVMFLYRNNVSAIPVFEALYNRGVPFTGDKFIKATQLPVISDLVALIELARHPNDISYFWILKRIRYEFGSYSTVAELPIVEAMKEAKCSLLELNYSFKDELGGTALMEALIDIKQMLRERKSVRDIFNRLWAPYCRLYLDANSYKLEREPEYYVGLVQGLVQTKTYKKFIDDEEDKYAKYLDSTERRVGVGCYTLHGAKGLEADDVYILEAEEGVIPNDKAIQEAIDLGCIIDAAEAVRNERSLIFVGITRAKRKCVIAYNNTLSPIVVGDSRYADLDRAYKICDIDYKDITAFLQFVSFNIMEDDFLDKLNAMRFGGL